MNWGYFKDFWNSKIFIAIRIILISVLIFRGIFFPESFFLVSYIYLVLFGGIAVLYLEENDLLRHIGTMSSCIFIAVLFFLFESKLVTANSGMWALLYIFSGLYLLVINIVQTLIFRKEEKDQEK